MRGDRTAFESLYEQHWKAVYRFAWLLTNSVPDAEDITQECFLALMRKPSAFDPNRAQLRTWLIGVARNQHLYRRRHQACRADDDALETCELPGSFEKDLIRMERADAVRHAVAALPPMQRQAVYLFEFEGLSIAEIAAILEIEPNAVKARLYRAREQLKRLLATLRKKDHHD